MSIPDPLELFDFADLAKKWKTGEDWLRRGVSARTLPHHRIAGQIKFTHEDAAEILASLKVRPAHVPTRDEVADKRAGVAKPDRRVS